MGFFTDAELGQLYISKMSLHLIGHSDEFEPRPELPIEHDEFLLDVLKSAASASVYEFNEVSNTKEKIEAIARGDIGFEEGAQDLARDFSRLHTGSGVSDGAFFVFELSQSDEAGSRFYALIKYDYYKALELEQREEGAGLREIVEAFVSDKNAIQKAAIIRVVDGVVRKELSTKDRAGKPLPNVTDYFQKYLEIRRERADDELTKVAKNTVRNALDDVREDIPGEFGTAVARGYQVLRDAETITEDVIKHAAWVGAGQPEAEDAKNKLGKAVTRHIKKNKLEGIQFVADRAVLRPTIKKKISTDEGVKIEYDTELDNGVVMKERMDDGTTVFTIRTRGFKEDVSAEKIGKLPR